MSYYTTIPTGILYEEGINPNMLQTYCIFSSLLSVDGTVNREDVVDHIVLKIGLSSGVINSHLSTLIKLNYIAVNEGILSLGGGLTAKDREDITLTKKMSSASKQCSIQDQDKFLLEWNNIYGTRFKPSKTLGKMLSKRLENRSIDEIISASRNRKEVVDANSWYSNEGKMHKNVYTKFLRSDEEVDKYLAIEEAKVEEKKTGAVKSFNFI